MTFTCPNCKTPMEPLICRAAIACPECHWIVRKDEIFSVLHDDVQAAIDDRRIGRQFEKASVMA